MGWNGMQIIDLAQYRNPRATDLHLHFLATNPDFTEVNGKTNSGFAEVNGKTLIDFHGAGLHPNKQKNVRMQKNIGEMDRCFLNLKYNNICCISDASCCFFNRS